jgi:drug/metabolite transporter (DMT)-like permease
MQKFTTPTKAAIIFCMEPVSSAFFSHFLGKEIMLPRQYIGAFLIVVAMVVCQGEFFFSNSPKSSPPFRE